MTAEFKKVIDLYNQKQTFIQRCYNVSVNILTINWGDALKECFKRKLSIEDKNTLLTQELSKIISSQKCEDSNVASELDNFLKEKIGEELDQLFSKVIDELKIDDTIEFNAFAIAAEKLLEENKEREGEIIEKAKTLESIAYPLTKKYFLFRYLAKAIIYDSVVSSTIEGSYKREKNLCLCFSDEIKKLVESSAITEKTNKKFNHEKKYVSFLLRISDAISNQSGKIATFYVTAVATITYLRYDVIDEDDPWYQLVAVPTTLLAVLQVFAAFPQIIFSGTKAKKINNYILEQCNRYEIQFLNKNIPAFSHNILSQGTIGIRWLTNLMLQPIDLIQNHTKDYILRITALRWLVPTGVIEEQSKVARFVEQTLNKFFYDSIVPALLDDKKINNSKYIKRLFHLLYTQIKKDESEISKLKNIYVKLIKDIKADVDFECIVSDKEKKQISRYRMWPNWTYAAAVLTLISEYLCFCYRDQDTNWYEDKMFYCATAVKFMRFGSLVASKYHANQITEYFTGNKLTNNIYFQDFFYNDAARMIAAVVPLIMFESTDRVTVLSIATAIDVLTTVRSDEKSGKAMSMSSKSNTRKLATSLSDCETQDLLSNRHII